MSLCIFLLFLVILNQLGLKINMFDGKMLRMNSFANPIIILISFSCFNIFSTLDLKKRLISNLSSITLYIYMIHENQLIRDYLKPVFFENYGCNLISVLKLFFLSIVICIPLGLIYKYCFSKIIYYILEPIINIVKKIYKYIESYLCNELNRNKIQN